MAKEAEKRVLVDFPAKLILLRGNDKLGYPKVQPRVREFVISHSWRPQGGCHARAFENGKPVSDLGELPESCLCYVDVKPGERVRVYSPGTAATVSLAPTEFDGFGGLVAFRDKATGDLLIEGKSPGTISVVFWRRGNGPREYEPISTASSYL